MDTQKLIVLLRATMDPNERKSAEDQLTQVRVLDKLAQIGTRQRPTCARGGFSALA